MNPQELFEQLTASVGPNYAADMVRVRFPEWDCAPRAKPMIGEDLHSRSSVNSTIMGRRNLHKAIWRDHPEQMKALALIPRCNVVAP